MKLGKKTFFSLLLGIDLLANLLELTHVNFLYIGTLISFCTYIFLPGFLISLILRIRKISFWENLLFIIGLSIAFLEFGGLLLNILLPLFGVNNPLAFQNLVIGFDIYVLLLLIFAWIRTEQFVVRIQLRRCSSIEKVMYALPVFFPILATLGAIVINNGGSNILTLILLAAIALYSLILILLRDKIATDLFPYALFFIGTACLFTTSLRSWYISGHDVELEYYVFKLTNIHHLWKMSFYQDPYNACLSITILPTILTNLLSIQDMYIYKVIFQILFATSPVLVFFIIRNYAIPGVAFLSAFFFVSFPTFFNDMAMLNRQEIGFIFFGLVLYMMLKRTHSRQFYSKFNIITLSNFSLSKRRLLFIIFGLSVIVSHYSTNFVLLALITFVYVVIRIISLQFMKSSFATLLSKFRITLKTTFTNQVFLNLPLLLILLISTYIWNNLYTQSSSHVGSVIAEVFDSFIVRSNSQSQSYDLSYSIFFAPKLDPKQQLEDYIQSIRQVEGQTNSADVNNNKYYSQSIISKYPSYPLPQGQLAPTQLGNLLTSLHIPVFTIQAELRSLSASLMQVFVFIGLIVIFLFRNRKSFDLQYLVLCLGSLILLVLLTLLPNLSVEYGILRMFQQVLFMLSLPIVIGLSSILFFAKEQKRILVTGVIAIIFFLNLTGFIAHLTGDYYPQMTLDNSGLYYASYYVQKSDILAMSWISANDVNNYPVDTDLSGTNKLLTYGDINAFNAIFPEVIQKNAYVFLEFDSNTVVAIDRSIVIFSSPKPFLDNNKNHIYSNGKDNIYK